MGTWEIRRFLWGKELEEAELFSREAGFISRTSIKKDKDSEEPA